MGYVNSDGKTQYGYVKTQNLSPYTQLCSVSFKVGKVDFKETWTVYPLYALPFENEEDAIEIAQLAERFVGIPQRKIQQEKPMDGGIFQSKTAYVRTENIKASGLTSWQLALVITIRCVIVAIIIAVVFDSNG